MKYINSIRILEKYKINKYTYIVDILWAIAKVVFELIMVLRLSYTNFSLAESNALVASSNNKIFDYLRIALAIATLYF